MAISTPMFWYHQGQRAHQLPDARSDVKGRTLLRRIRSGYTAISPSRTPESQSPRPESIAETDETPPGGDDEQQPPPQQQQQQQQHLPLPPTPPEYEAERPPPYAGQPLPPALPGYTPLPGTLEEPARPPARDLVFPGPLAARRRYRDALRRRLTSTRRLFAADGGGASDAASLCDSESARGVVLYRENDRWVGTGGAAAVQGGGKGDLRVETRRGFRGWLKRAWGSLMEFLDEHPYLFVLAVFVIVVVVICMLI